VNEYSDQQLLRVYASTRQETAFSELVRRHIDLVYSAALRMLRDAHLAQDITQGVFVALAGHAAQLADHPVLSGWLHCTARNLAAKAVRSNARRRVREQEAVAMNELHAAGSEPSWDAIAPHLDAALGELSDTDRDILLLRYFERKTASEMAGLLGISDEAAQKRVTRALDRLRELFIKRGMSVGAGGLVVVLTANAVQAAPVGLAAAISTAAVTPSAVTTSTLIATTKTIAMTTLQKSIITATIAVLAGTGIYQARQSSQLRSQLQATQQQQSPLTEQLKALQRQQDQQSGELAQFRDDNQHLRQDQAELLQLRGEVAVLRRQQQAPKPETSGRSALVNASLDENSSDDVGRKLGMAVVHAESQALEKLASLARAEYLEFNTNSPGLSDDERGHLSMRVFAPLKAAFQVIQDAAVQGNQNAIDAIISAVRYSELRGEAVQGIGALAAVGNNDALDVLVNYDQYGFPLSGVVSALELAAGHGDQKAIDFLAAVARDPRDQALWYHAAIGLTASAGSGNTTAIDALIQMSGNTNASIRNAVITGLQAAASNHSSQAAAALRSLNAP